MFPNCGQQLGSNDVTVDCSSVATGLFQLTCWNPFSQCATNDLVVDSSQGGNASLDFCTQAVGIPCSVLSTVFVIGAGLLILMKLFEGSGGRRR